MPSKIQSKQIVIIGKERSGKTYFTERYAENFAASKGCSFVYNVGMPSDYEDYEKLELMDIDDHYDYYFEKKGKDFAKRYQKRPKIELFKYKGNVYHYKDFSGLFYKKKVKTKSLFAKEDSLFWRNMHDHFTRTLVVCDDSKVLFKDGIKKGHYMCMNRKNHTGEKSTHYNQLGQVGIDMILMFHNCDQINKDIWDFTTDLILLDTVSKPRLSELRDIEQKDKVLECWRRLKKSPKHTALHLSLKGKNYLQIKDVTI